MNFLSKKKQKRLSFISDTKSETKSNIDNDEMNYNKEGYSISYTSGSTNSLKSNLFKNKKNDINLKQNENNNKINNEISSNKMHKFINNDKNETVFYTNESIAESEFNYDEYDYKNNYNTKDEHKCNLCLNRNSIKDSFMILTCGHIFHIKCLVDNHYSDANKHGVIDEEYLNNRCCLICNKQMEIEDILYVHNKFYKNTKDYLIKQQENIEKLDKQMTKLKEELRICYDYKQKLENQREKSKQITIMINTLM